MVPRTGMCYCLIYAFWKPNFTLYIQVMLLALCMFHQVNSEHERPWVMTFKQPWTSEKVSRVFCNKNLLVPWMAWHTCHLIVINNCCSITCCTHPLRFWVLSVNQLRKQKHEHQWKKHHHHLSQYTTNNKHDIKPDNMWRSNEKGPD